MSDIPRRADVMPWVKRWDEPRSGTPGQVLDNAVKERPLLYGPHGEVVMKEVPRPVGFRPPQEQAS